MLIPTKPEWPLQLFAHAIAAQLSWHVQISNVIWRKRMELEQNEFSIKFELPWVKIR